MLTAASANQNAPLPGPFPELNRVLNLCIRPANRLVFAALNTLTPLPGVFPGAAGRAYFWKRRVPFSLALSSTLFPVTAHGGVFLSGG